MDTIIKEQVTEIIMAYKKNGEAYAEILRQIEAARQQIRNLESNVKVVTSELTEIRQRESELFATVAESGSDIELFNAEVMELIKNIKQNGTA